MTAQKQKQQLVENQIQSIRNSIKTLKTFLKTGSVYLDKRQKHAVYSIAVNELAPLQWS